MMENLILYFSQTVSDSHLSLAVSILTTMMICGCLVILVENQHIKGEITSRYYNIMRPFNRKLALYAIFAQRYLLALEAADDVGKAYAKSLNKESEGIVKLSCEVVETGKDVFDIKAKKLNSICNDINRIWYIFDRNSDIDRHLIIHDKILIEDVRKSLVEYDRTLSNEEIDLDILPKVSGDFYVKEWQPIDNVPYKYEYFNKQSRVCNRCLYGSFLIEIIGLVIMYLGEGFHVVSLFLVDLLVLLSMFSFVFSLYKHLGLNGLLIKLQF